MNSPFMPELTSFNLAVAVLEWFMAQDTNDASPYSNWPQEDYCFERVHHMTLQRAIEHNIPSVWW